MQGTAPDRTRVDFQPINNPRPRALSQAALAQYNALGYISPLAALGTEEISQARAYFDQLLSQVGQANAYAINCYQARCQGIWDLCHHPRILDYVEDIIGPNIVCWASHFFCKLPHDNKTVPWHQDAIYWRLTPRRTVTVWLAIDDADEGNGALQFMPKTHNQGELPWAEQRDQTLVLDKVINNPQALGTPVFNCLKAGEISLHADMLAHASEPNTSTRRRCGLTLRYCPPEVRITDSQWQRGIESILCRGQDPSGHWSHHPRPEGDDVSPKNSPRNLGGN